MTSPAGTVLDASALLSYLQGETGGDLVAAALVEGAHISSVNWAEVLTKLADRGRTPTEVIEELEDRGILNSGLFVEPATGETARTIAELRSATRRAGLSLGDRACLALASELGLPALTTDRAWKDLAVGVEVRAIR